MISLLFALFTTPVFAVDLDQVQRELQTTGAVGWIHGAVEDQGLYVFTYRNPENFFDYVELSLTSEDPAILAKFAELVRHDKVNVKGDFIPMKAPQKHIAVTSIEMVKKFDPAYSTDPYQHQVQIPEELWGQTSGLFLVHAIAAEGQILVVEYKDTVLPIFVKNGELTRSLYRGDLVELHFKVRIDPSRPAHLSLIETDPDAVKVIQSIVEQHDKPITIQGRLVLFPKSPQISLNVFAVQELLPGGLNRQYTLVNFENPAIFNGILQSCQDAWDRHPTRYINGRNKLVSQAVEVRVSGIINEVSPNQANPQILITNLTDLQFIETK